ncbi:MAG TPA: helix-turn-helix domain-containing protein [Acidimicrobiales bacterium]|nr:helix-turn-helix domain-containing protein [Acidimicrobiales bacterium]
MNSSASESAETPETASDSCVKAVSACDEALARAFRFLGKRWSGVILGTLANGPVGFAELRRRVAGISDSVLAERLSDLQAAGLILRDVQPGPPVSVTYALAPAGSALLPAMHELSVWASGNLPGAAVSS